MEFNKNKRKRLAALGVAAVMAVTPIVAVNVIASDSSTMYANSDFIETEQPVLSPETKALISAYQANPTEEAYLELRAMVMENYNAVLDRKEAKLAELKEETAGKPGGDAIVAEMEDIVQDMYKTYWNRINSSMLRFTDTRLLKWRITNAANYAYIPVMGAGESIYVKRTPVTNAEYAEFITATGAAAPENWADGMYAAGEEDYPVNFASYDDALAYCAWLTENDGTNTYRLPNESEWELAAGHMPKDAAFNCGINDGRTSVNEYADVTRGAHGAIDFWGNVWEWTSTVRSDGTNGVKGGAYDSARTDCRTEYRQEGRQADLGYENVGFRVIQVKDGIEPEQSVELASLPAAVVTAEATADTVTLSWDAVEGANDYQLFTYDAVNDKVMMIQRDETITASISENSATFYNLTEGNTYCFIVQPISYVQIADNVDGAYAVTATCSTPVFRPATFTVSASKTSIRVGNSVNISATTSTDVSSIIVNGTPATLMRTNTRTGQSIWKAVITPAEVGTATMEIVAFDATGVSSEAQYIDITVNAAPTKTSRR